LKYMFLTRREKYHRLNYELRDERYLVLNKIRTEILERTIDLEERYNFYTSLCDD